MEHLLTLLPDQWLAPSHIETPDLLADIKKFIDNRFSIEKFEGIDATRKRKLTVIVERLEFIDHLSAISELLLKENSVKICSIPLGDGKVQLIENHSIKIGGHDFSGFDYDADALSVYLLLTCIDTIKGKAPYADPFDWLKRNHSPGDSLDWDDLSSKYQQDFGLSKLFRQAFTSDSSEPLREELATFFAVAKIGQQRIKPGSDSAWVKRSPSERVDRIASHLYAIRSAFTHSSSRSFSPAVPVRRALDEHGDVLLQRIDGRPLRIVLAEIIKDLAKKLLCDPDQ